MGKGYKDLLVWQKARDLAVLIYSITNQTKFKKDYALCDQVRRSVVSVPSNIAEGDERDTDKESVHFFFIAKGSLAELRTQMDIAYQVGYIDENVFLDVEDKAIQIGKMLGALIKARTFSR
ncbi:MAG: four helix bundle protein [Smithellaceae bacterium]|nr:four helix bundle protein [Smithellaceae bacterium]